MEGLFAVDPLVAKETAKGGGGEKKKGDLSV